MSALIETDTGNLFKDEPCYLLSEMNLPHPLTQEKHRFQIIYVNRGDVVKDFWRDLGLAELFDHAEFRWPIIWEHSVQEAVEQAERIRANSVHMGDMLKERAATSTLIHDFLQQREEQWLAMKNVSQFGPWQKTQRNGWSIADATEAVNKGVI